MSAPFPVLAVENLSFIRNKRIILNEITFDITSGEHWVILGPNGCGKTSLINCVTGYEMATQGKIAVSGSEYGHTDWREVRKQVGLVTATLSQYLQPSEPVLDIIVSGRDAMLNINFDPGADLKAEAAVLLERIGCSYLSSSRWGTLSQGERQKILICRALMANFAILILDEPCAGLDPVAREHFLQWLQKIATDPSAPSLVLVTHHVEEILPCFTHVLLLKAGEVLAKGPKAGTLNSQILTEAYGAEVRINSNEKRYTLEIVS